MTTEVQRVGFTKAIRAGVKIAYGTDACVYPHGDNARQLSYYVDHGLSPAQTIQSATRWASELMGWKDRVGSLTPGIYADLVITKGNPLDDIKLLENLSGVMKGGEWVIEPLH
jgi:imidazolonepropionase-like amidohydrolase